MRKFKACYPKQYQDQQGQDKTSWKTIGYANEVVSQDGKVTIHLSLDSIPTGSWDGDIKLYLQDEQGNNNQNGNGGNNGNYNNNANNNNGGNQQHNGNQQQYYKGVPVEHQNIQNN